jgi:hypothetical protein
MIRRGGVPSGAAAFIVFGGMYVTALICNSWRGRFNREMSSKFSPRVLVAFRHHIRFMGNYPSSSICPRYSILFL